MGEKLLKLILVLFVCLVFGLFCPQSSFAQNNTDNTGSTDAPVSQVAPPTMPTIKDAQSFWRGIWKEINSFFKNFKIIGKGINSAGSFFKSVGDKIGYWWSSKAKPWSEYYWTNFNIYLNQEIRIE